MKIYLLSILLVSSQISFAQNAQQVAVINGNERPSVESLIANPQLLQSFSLPPYENYRDPQAFIDAIPALATALEKAFPGGTYGFLGRDMDLVADALEAFYLAIGQRGRVVRIRLSTPSFTNLQPSTLIEYLQGLGLAKPTQKPKSPFVVVDVTNYTVSSQSNLIMTAVMSSYQRAIPAGESATSWINLGAFDRGQHTTPVTMRNPLQMTAGEINDMLARQKSRSVYDQSRLSEVFSLPGMGLAYYSEWHDKYGHISRDNRTGLLFTARSGYFDYEVKRKVFHNMIVAINTMIKPTFIATALDYALKSQGVKFSNSSTFSQTPVVNVDYNKEFLHALSNLQIQPLDTESEYKNVEIFGLEVKLTPNGAMLFSQLANPDFALGSDYFAIAMRSLISFYEHDMIGSRDVRRILISILGRKELPKKNEKSTILNGQSVIDFLLSKSHLEPIRIFLDREREREKYLGIGGVAGQNYTTLVNGGARPTYNCSKLFSLAM